MNVDGFYFYFREKILIWYGLKNLSRKNKFINFLEENVKRYIFVFMSFGEMKSFWKDIEFLIIRKLIGLY